MFDVSVYQETFLSCNINIVLHFYCIGLTVEILIHNKDIKIKTPTSDQRRSTAYRCTFVRFSSCFKAQRDFYLESLTFFISQIKKEKWVNKAGFMLSYQNLIKRRKKSNSLFSYLPFLFCPFISLLCDSVSLMTSCFHLRATILLFWVSCLFVCFLKLRGNEMKTKSLV